MPSILSLIADDQLNNVRNRNRVYDENASYLYPVQTIVYPDIIQSDNDDLSTIGFLFLSIKFSSVKLSFLPKLPEGWYLLKSLGVKPFIF